MAVEWTTYCLGDLCDFVNGFAFKSTDYVPKSTDTVEVFRMGYIARGGGFKEDDSPVFVPRDYNRNLTRFRLQSDDIAIAMTDMKDRVAILGNTAWIHQPDRFVLNQRVGCIRVKRNDTVDARFLYYYSNWQPYLRDLRSRANSGVQVNLSTSAIKESEILLPPLAEQKAIASVLGALDDKIELNRRMNATLKAMGRALFQSWFVDFDPVRAKLDGRQLHSLDEATAGVFPDALQDSPIGPVPEGWKVERFDAHITPDRGLSYKGEGLRDDRSGLPMHNLNSIYEGGGYKYEGIKYYAGEYREKHLLEPGDMIVTNTEQGFDHLLIGHAAIVPKCYGPKGLFSHHIYRVRQKASSPFSSHYLVELFNNRRWHSWISGFSNGTTINMLPMDALEMPMLVVPPVELVKQFTALAEAAYLQVEQNKEQSRTLAIVRDTLLPKLLSGNLRMKRF